MMPSKKQLSIHKQIVKYYYMRKLRVTNKKNYKKKLEALTERLFEELHAKKEAEKWLPANPAGVLDRKKIIILTSKHTDFIARRIASVLEAYNFDTSVIYEYDASVYDDKENLYFVLSPNIFTKGLPEHYFAFNLEQTISDRWFTEDYISKLNNAIGVLDYSLTNVDFLQKKEIAPKRVFYAPIAPIPAQSCDMSKRTTDILFYGDNHSPRRHAILGKLAERFNIKIVNNLFHDEMLRELDNAKIVLNIHYYEGAMLETPRLCEAISRGCLVVSETAINDDEYPELQAMTDFAKVDDVEGLEKRLEYWLSNPDALQQKVDENQTLAKNCFQKFSYHIARVLMNHDLVSFESFYRNEKDFFSLDGGRICIGLPESIERQNYFKSINKYGFKMFPAIKHSSGWIGCATTYKFLARKAVDEGLKSLIICEDDVEFPVDFAEKVATAEKHFTSAKPDIFSGFLVDLHPDAVVSDITTYDNLEIVTTNKVVSTVFAMYTADILRVLANWDNANRDVYTNTIDRYLESQKNLRVAFAYPFLVGHNESMNSTLWRKQNGELYAKMMQGSLDRIDSKLKAYQKTLKK